MASLCFDTCEHAFVAGPACGDNVVEDSCEFVRGGSDRGGSPETGSQTAEILSEIRLTAIQRLGSHAQSHSKSADHLAGFHGEDSSAADPIIWTKPQPGSKGSPGGKLLEV